MVVWAVIDLLGVYIWTDATTDEDAYRYQLLAVCLNIFRRENARELPPTYDSAASCGDSKGLVS